MANGQQEPIDLSSFTTEQKQLFNRAAALGSGLETVGGEITPPVPQAGATIGTAGTPIAPGGDDSFLAELQKRLLSDTGIVSSGQTEIDESIQQSIASREAAQTASAGAVTSQFDREIAFQKEQFEQQRTAFREAGRGFATNQAALRQLDEGTEKSLRDLEQRKQELILQGDAAAASDISKLEFDAIQFRQQAQQQEFNNLVSSANLALNFRQEDRLAKAQRTAIANEALGRIDTLRKLGSFSLLGEKDLRSLEQEALLPEGSLANAGDISNSEIRTVGNTLLAVDPATNEVKVLFQGGQAGGDVSLGGVGISAGTASIINGMQSFGDLSSSQRDDVSTDLGKLGFFSDTVPNWFKDRIEQAKQQSFTQEGLSGEWDDFKISVMSGGKLTPELLEFQLTTREIEKAAKNAGVTKEVFMSQLMDTVRSFEQAGFDNKTILQMLQS